ncbi:MAG: type II toxin-antitoxin system HicB family antitoxin [Gammaproteobacteria bacterium]|jgi:predicted RNase H-like HicB family nuclease
MKNFKYVVYQEEEHYVSQCLNVDVASFGNTIDEAINNLKEAVELYMEDDNGKMEFHQVGDALIGESVANA